MNVRITAMAVAAAAVAFATSLSAQNVPSQFVVSGKLAEQIQDFNTINLATAERIAETCEKLAAAENVAITMYVLDNDGNHVYMDRMDGQGYLNIITAEMKARTALAQRAPSKVVMNQVRRDPNAELQYSAVGSAGDDPKSRASRRPAGQVKIGVIESVECLRAELDVSRFRKRKVL